MNKVILMGRLTRDAEIRYSQGESSTAIARFSLAVDRRFRRDNDEQSADFIILADESPVRHSRLFCTRWNGITKASGIVDALDDKEYTGSLVTLLQAGTDFVRNNSKKAWRKVGDGKSIPSDAS